MRVRTNRHWRPFRYRNEVPPAVLEQQFDWLDEDESQDYFFQYQGYWYHLSQFNVVPDNLAVEWDGILNDSMTTGTLIRVSRNCESYRVGRFAA